MQIDIPAAAARAIGILEQHGFAAYLVGGCVRDACRGAQPYDWDIATSALPAEILEVFADFRTIPTGLRHGTVTVRMDGEPLEITTFRSDGVYTDHRRPDGVTFVDDLQADLVRRDFTVNAMAYNPRVGLVDLFGGCDDLEKGILRAVGDPDRRFDEDALRILRALRFAARFGFAIEARTGAAMRRKAHLLACVSRERVFEELKKLLMGAYAGKVLLDYADIVQAVLPEIGPTIGFDQHSRHHLYDVWAHTAHAVAAAPFDLPVRLALLLHDLGKPQCFTRDDGGEGHFYGHAGISAAMAEAVLLRLRCDNDTRACVTRLVANHGNRYPVEEKTARRLLSKFGPEDARRLLWVMQADKAACAPTSEAEQGEIGILLDLLDRVEAEAPCLTLRDLAVRGGDLMALGYAGPAIGEALNRLLEAVLDGRCENEKAALLALLQ